MWRNRKILISALLLMLVGQVAARSHWRSASTSPASRPAARIVSSGPIAETPRDWAAFIAIQDYLDRRIPLNVARRDAVALERSLRGLAALHETTILRSTDEPGSRNTPTLAGIVGSLPNWLRSIPAGDRVFITFSGHGLLSDSGELHLALRDSILGEAEETALPISQLLDWLRQSKASSAVLILDCCEAGLAVDAAGRSQRDVHQRDSWPGLTIFAGCRRGEGCWELPELGLSLFTYALTRSMSPACDVNRDGKLQFTEIAERVCQDVEQLTRRRSIEEQHPLLWMETEQSLTLPILRQP